MKIVTAFFILTRVLHTNGYLYYLHKEKLSEGLKTGHTHVCVYYACIRVIDIVIYRVISMVQNYFVFVMYTLHNSELSSKTCMTEKHVLFLRTDSGKIMFN